MMPWLVVGTGALGSLMAVRLQQAGQQVQLKSRASSNLPTQLAINFEQQTCEFPVLKAWPGHAVNVFAAIKAYQVAPLLAELRDQPLPAGSQLVLSYNGMLEHEATLVPPTALHWVTTHGAFRHGDELVHAGRGESWLGWANPDVSGSAEIPAELLTVLGAALPPLTAETDMTRRRWSKLAVNCLINPLTVVHQCRNGDLLSLPVADLMQTLATEISWLAAQYGVDLPAAEIVGLTRRVASQTAANWSSMLSDVRNQRPTEIDYLNGYIASGCQRVGAAAPANEQLWQQVTTLTKDFSHLR
ncbi:2-dehydropantoate 2-reductase [Pseudidiomarina sp.]|uniref:ketopantoate reductase family protein n=1 Tax=Pseudidiomarina sp. TaxID=2081707 RepID=UPI00299D1C91|nr:2-dehydropantoate 2-reductase [Pseudidiomarina sp.]MDX1705120.1 2-dehydropantoate 2-reductase [Pseudidiomarina sp.]